MMSQSVFGSGRPLSGRIALVLFFSYRTSPDTAHSSVWSCWIGTLKDAPFSMFSSPVGCPFTGSLGYSVNRYSARGMSFPSSRPMSCCMSCACASADAARTASASAAARTGARARSAIRARDRLPREPRCNEARSSTVGRRAPDDRVRTARSPSPGGARATPGPKRSRRRMAHHPRSVVRSASPDDVVRSIRCRRGCALLHRGRPSSVRSLDARAHDRCGARTLTRDHRARMRSPAEAAELLHATDDLLLPLAPAQPAGFLRALARRDELRELRIWCALLQERFDVL